jgi:thiol-disulfide isomerase/thioredoxin
MLSLLLFFIFQFAHFCQHNFFNVMESNKDVGFFYSQSDSFPDFSLFNQNHNLVELYKIKPKAYSIIAVWEKDCTSCKTEFTNLSSLDTEYHNRISFISIFIGSDQKEWKKCINKFRLRGINLIDDNHTLEKKLSINKTPLFYLIDNDFRILEKSEHIQFLKRRLENYYFINDGLDIKNRPVK